MIDVRWTEHPVVNAAPRKWDNVMCVWRIMYFAALLLVWPIATTAQEVVASIPVGGLSSGVAVSADGAFLYIPNDVVDTTAPFGFTSSVLVIAAATNKAVARIPVGWRPGAIALTPNGAFAYVESTYSGYPFYYTVSVIDTAINRVVATVQVGNNPAGIAITPNGEYVYVANQTDNTVSVIATKSNSVIATINVGNSPTQFAMTPDGAYLYLTNHFGNSVSVIATATNTVVATIPVGEGPVPIVLTPNGALAYVQNSADGTVSVISTASNTVVATIKTQPTPIFVMPGDNNFAITSNGAYVYVVNGINTVSVIATATNTVVATVPVGHFPYGVVITPDGKFAYVVNNDDWTLSVIATTNNSVIATVPLGFAPWGVTMNPKGTSAYVYGYDGSVYVISMPTATKFSAAVSLTSGYNPALPLQSIPLVAKITGNNPTGTVTFRAGESTNRTLCDAVPLRATSTAGQSMAYCVASGWDVVSPATLISAVYSGDAANWGASSVLNEEVFSSSSFNPNQASLTGLWYAPATSGQGFAAEVLEDFPNAGAGLFFAGWYTYAADGTSQEWYALQGNVPQTGMIGIYSASGGRFDTPIATNPVESTLVGNVQIIFGDCSHMTIAYTFTDGSGRKGNIPLQRLDVNHSCTSKGGVGGYTGTSQQYSGAWYNPATSGQGFVFDFSPSQQLFFAGWYTYDLGGHRTWFTIQGNWSIVQTSASNLAIYQASNGVFNEPAPIKSQQVGTASLTLLDCAHASLSYTFNAGPLSGLAGTMPLQPVASAMKGCR